MNLDYVKAKAEKNCDTDIQKTSDGLYKPDILSKVICTIISGNFSSSLGMNLNIKTTKDISASIFSVSHRRM